MPWQPNDVLPARNLSCRILCSRRRSLDRTEHRAVRHPGRRAHRQRADFREPAPQAIDLAPVLCGARARDRIRAGLSRQKNRPLAGAANLMSCGSAPGAKVPLFAGFTAVYFITAAFFLPETKGKTLEEIEEHFEGKKS